MTDYLELLLEEQPEEATGEQDALKLPEERGQMRRGQSDPTSGRADMAEYVQDRDRDAGNNGMTEGESGEVADNGGRTVPKDTDEGPPDRAESDSRLERWSAWNAVLDVTTSRSYTANGERVPEPDVPAESGGAGWLYQNVLRSRTEAEFAFRGEKRADTTAQMAEETDEFSPRTLDRLLERDARRYDRTFPLY